MFLSSIKDLERRKVVDEEVVDERRYRYVRYASVSVLSLALYCIYTLVSTGTSTYGLRT